MILSLSTSWNSKRHDTGDGIVKEVKAAGFDTVELNFSLSRRIVDDILRLKESGSINVSSLHNICPLPADIPPETASPDYYSLSATDESERSLAVGAAKSTLEFARRFGAVAVVLHAGRVPIKDRTRELACVIHDAESAASLRRSIIDDRARHAAPYLANTIRSLEDLVPYARRLGVRIGVENRYYYREIPTMEEFDILFDHFGNEELYYWHDVGHAEVSNRLGLAKGSDILGRFSNRLIGVHLHDIIGPTSDHRAPGSGTFDFGLLREHIRPSTILVMEVHGPVGSDEIRRGADHLMKALRL